MAINPDMLPVRHHDPEIDIRDAQTVALHQGLAMDRAAEIEHRL